jgi:hypothetical protein
MNVEEIFQQVMNEDCENPLHRFAELVEAAAVARAGGMTIDITDLVNQVKAEEREACALLLEAEAKKWDDNGGIDESYALLDCAKQIRGRTE